MFSSQMLSCCLGSHKGWIQDYVKENIPKLYQDNYEEFVPLVQQRIEAICENWLGFMQIVVQEDKECYRLYGTINANLDEKGVELITRIFCDKYQIKSSYMKACQSTQGENTLLNLMPEGYRFEVGFYWTPQNPYIYGGQKKYQFDPMQHIKQPWIQAKRGELTDITFRVQGKELQAHKQILKLKCPHFIMMFDSGFKESQSETVEISDCTLDVFKSLLRFLYTGQISLKRQNNLTFLVELFKQAHLRGISKLADYCIDLMNIILKNGITDINQFEQVLELATTYQVDEFTLLCLKFANNQPGNTELWDILKDRQCLPRLLHIATKNSLEVAAKQLMEKTERMLSL